MTEAGIESAEAEATAGSANSLARNARRLAASSSSESESDDMPVGMRGGLGGTRRAGPLRARGTLLPTSLTLQTEAVSPHPPRCEGRVVVEAGDVCRAELDRGRGLASIGSCNARFSRFQSCGQRKRSAQRVRDGSVVVSDSSGGVGGGLKEVGAISLDLDLQPPKAAQLTE